MPEGGKHSFYLVIANECKFVFEIRLIKNTLWSLKLKKGQTVFILVFTAWLVAYSHRVW